MKRVDDDPQPGPARRPRARPGDRLLGRLRDDAFERCCQGGETMEVHPLTLLALLDALERTETERARLQKLVNEGGRGR